MQLRSVAPIAASRGVARRLSALQFVHPIAGHPAEKLQLALPTACSAPSSTSRCGAQPELGRAALLTGEESAAAAKKILTLFTHARSRVIGHKLYPVGVMVSANVRLLGFSGTEATLCYSLYTAATGPLLSPEWYSTVPVANLSPDGSDASYVAEFWVVLPKPVARYYVQLEVYDPRQIERLHKPSRWFKY